MKYESLIYKGFDIKIVHEASEENFTGSYVHTLWFPDIDRAKDFIDRMTIQPDMNSQ